MASTTNSDLKPLFPYANEGSTEFAIDQQFDKLDKKINTSGGTTPTKTSEDPNEFKTEVHEAVNDYLNSEESPLDSLVSNKLKNLSDADVNALKKVLGIDK